MANIAELRLMQQDPRLYLANYLTDLKASVDSHFSTLPEEKEAWLQIIKSIESFEHDAYNNIQPLDNGLKEEVQTLLGKAESNIDSGELDRIQYKVERHIFGNKSIYFKNNYCVHSYYTGGTFANDEWGGEWHKTLRSFLLIVNDEFIGERTMTNPYLHNSSEDIRLLTRDGLLACLLNSKLRKFIDDNSRLSGISVVKLDVDVANTVQIEARDVDQFSTFYGISACSIEGIAVDAFRGFARLEKIDFYMTKVRELLPGTLNGLTRLKSFSFQQSRHHRFEKLDPSFFQGLHSLEDVSLGGMPLMEIPAELFKGLTKLTSIYLDRCHLRHLDKNVFKGLTSLRTINISYNEFEANPQLFLEPSVEFVALTVYDWNCNEIEKVRTKDN